MKGWKRIYLSKLDLFGRKSCSRGKFPYREARDRDHNNSIPTSPLPPSPVFANTLVHMKRNNAAGACQGTLIVTRQWSTAYQVKLVYGGPPVPGIDTHNFGIRPLQSFPWLILVAHRISPEGNVRTSKMSSLPSVKRCETGQLLQQSTRLQGSLECCGPSITASTPWTKRVSLAYVPRIVTGFV